MLSIEVLLPPQHGMVEGLEVLGGIGVAEQPVEGRADEQRAEQRPLGVVGLGQEQLLRPGEGLGVELLQRGVGGDERILQSAGPEAELLRALALQHGGGTHGGGTACARGHSRQRPASPGTGNLLRLGPHSSLLQHPS